MSTIPANHCPLCEGSNDCAVAARQAASDCWCQRTAIDRTALARVQAATQLDPARCICQRCASQLAKLTRTLT